MGINVQKLGVVETIILLTCVIVPVIIFNTLIKSSIIIDFFAGIIGALIGLLILKLIKRRRQ